jgi:uncharacterized alkaline shock family protein YloU
MIIDDIQKVLCETDGVLAVAGEGAKGVKVTKSDSGLLIDVNVILRFGIRIPEMAWQLQQRVKDLISQSDTEYGGSEIDGINVNIRGIREKQ